MTPEQWQRIKELVDAALELDPAERPQFITRECGTDPAVCSEVSSLVGSHESGEGFMERPAVEEHAAVLLEEVGGESRPGDLFGRYEIVSRLATGGMGEVYLARDRRLGRRIALKLLPRYLCDDADRLRRFELEARAASALSHPNVCTIHEVGETEDGRQFIAMEHVAGVTLREMLEAGKTGTTEIVEIAVQIAAALVAAHEAGVIHRDIKPENVMVRPDGYVKVLDFGLAKLTKREEPDAAGRARKLGETTPGLIIGTARYMSPEQARGLPVDARTDIFSFGVILYEMIACAPPFDGETPTDVLLSVVGSEPAPLASLAPGVPSRLVGIVEKALAKDRAARHASARDLLGELKRVRNEIGLTPALVLRAVRELRGLKALAVRRALRQARAASRLSRRRVLALVAVALAVALAATALAVAAYVRYTAAR